MTKHTQNCVNLIHKMDNSILAVECLIENASFDDQVNSLLSVLAQSLRESHTDLANTVIPALSETEVR